MTPEELEKLPKPLERIMTALELDIMSEIIERIKEAMQITPVTDWMLNRLNIIGASKRRTKQILREALETADLQVDDIYDQAARSDYTRTKAIYEAAGQDYTPYEDNKYLQQVVDAVRRQTKDTLRPYENITQTTGFNIYMGGRRTFTPLSEYLERSLDRAMLGITTGMKTYSQAIGDVIDEMTYQLICEQKDEVSYDADGTASYIRSYPGMDKEKSSTEKAFNEAMEAYHEAVPISFSYGASE